MSRWTVVVLSVGIVVACGRPAPQSPSNQLAPGTIAWPASLDHPSTPETHHQAALQLLRDSGTEAGMTTMKEIMLRQQLAANPIIQPYEGVLRKFLDKYISFDALKDELAKVYMQHFSELQLRQITAFYQTPTGQAAVEKLPKVLEVAAALGKAQVEAHMEELKQAIIDQGPPPP